MRTLVAFIPFAGVYLAVRTGSRQRIAALLDGILVAALATMTVALGQIYAPNDYRLHFYPRGDYQYPIGLFTNHNHQALFLLATLPLAALRARDMILAPQEKSAGEVGHTQEPSQRARGGIISWLLAVYAIVALLMALATASRAGAALAPLALLGTVMAWFDSGKVVTLHKQRISLPIGLIALAAMLALGGAAVGAELIGGAFSRGAIASDQRWQFWPDVINATNAYWPTGAGIGTFIEAYGRLEPLRAVSSSVLNHAHNEYLEIALEAGVPGLVLTTLFLGNIVLSTWQAWRARGGAAASFVGRAATLPLVLIALHSVVDYPIRTFAVAALAALCFALKAQASAGLFSLPPE
jgi:O-antigen ligase